MVYYWKNGAGQARNLVATAFGLGDTRQRAAAKHRESLGQRDGRQQLEGRVQRAQPALEHCFCYFVGYLARIVIF